MICSMVLLLSHQLFAQVPQSFSYQAVAYDSGGELLITQSVGVKILILDGSVTGTILYEETHITTTNDYGIFTLKVGEGTSIIGNFSTIDWGGSLKFLDIFLDPDGGTSYTHVGTIQLVSVPYSLHAATANEVRGGITESDPIFRTSMIAGLSASDTSIWNDKLDDITESDPLFATSIAGIITQADTAIWNNKEKSFQETDPVFVSSLAAGITTTTTTNWNNALDTYTETDPVYGSSIAKGITGTDTTNWNNKLDSYTESDPVYELSIASGISATDATNWNNKLDSFSETDPVYESSIAGGITGADTTYWNDKLDTYNETDPVFDLSMAFGITETDTMYWNDKLDAEEDGSTSNEIQTISRNGLTVTLTDGDSFQDSINVYTPGPNIDIANNEISNTAPAPIYSIGDFAHGGIVFWIDETGEHGLVCAKQDYGVTIRWYAGTNGDTRAYGDGPFAGNMNTKIIIAAHVAIGDDGSTYAARVCAELKVTEGGISYADWYLPSKEELNQMYLNQSKIDSTATANGGSSFGATTYWSSTEFGTNGAWPQNFNTGEQSAAAKSAARRIRAIRKF